MIKISNITLAAFLLLTSCGQYGGQNRYDNKEKIPIVEDLVIGSLDQPIEYQLGRPIAVRTDDDGLIYIADRQSLNIKVYDGEGNHLRNLSGRGRGPGEMLDIELMEWNNDGNLVIMDRGNMRYTILDLSGEDVISYPYNEKFYPQSLIYKDDSIFALFFNSSSSFEKPILERNLFHEYSNDFQHEIGTFFSLKDLGIDNYFLANAMGFHPGSFALINEDSLVYSPSTYNGTLYLFKKDLIEGWKLDKTIEGKPPEIDPFEIYDSESEWRRAIDSGKARAAQVRDMHGTHWGSQFSMDAGVFSLDDGRIVHFFAEWKKGYERLEGSSSHPMDLYVQIFNDEGEVIDYGYVLTFTEQFFVPFYSVVNWMDNNSKFYLLEHPNDVPIVRRFQLDLDKNLDTMIDTND